MRGGNIDPNTGQELKSMFLVDNYAIKSLISKIPKGIRKKEQRKTKENNWKKKIGEMEKKYKEEI